MRKVVEVPSETIASRGLRGNARIVAARRFGSQNDSFGIRVESQNGSRES